MANPDPVRDAVRALKQRKQDLTQEMRRVDQALSALTGLSEQDGRGPAPQRPKGAPSVRVMLLTLLREDYDRDWSVAEIMAEYQKRGTPIHGTKPENALRAAITDAHKREQILRTAPGRYKAATSDSPRSSGQTRRVPEGSGYGFDEEPF